MSGQSTLQTFEEKDRDSSQSRHIERDEESYIYFSDFLWRTHRR